MFLFDRSLDRTNDHNAVASDQIVVIFDSLTPAGSMLKRRYLLRGLARGITPQDQKSRVL